MINSPFVSIVIPAYNHAEYLGEAIESVLNQDYDKVELIVLDDGSIDGTCNVLQKYTDKFYWESQANIGQADTLNKGWRMSRGDILSYLSADDFLLPQAVSAAVKYLQADEKTVLTYCDFALIDSESRIIRRVRAPEFNYRDMVLKCICPPGPGVFFRRDAFLWAGFWDNSLKQMPDYDYWLRLGLTGKFQRIPQVLASFRAHDESQTFARATEERAEEPVRIIRHFFQREDVPSDLVATKNQALSNAYLTAAQLHWRAGRLRSAYDRAKHAFSLCARNFLSIRTLRMIFNAAFNRLGHKLIWQAKSVVSTICLSDRHR